MTRNILFFIFFIFCSFHYATSAVGHTNVVDTFPKYKTIIQEMPKEILMTFDLALNSDTKINFLRLFDPSNNEITIESGVDKNSIFAKLPQIIYQKGTYTVRYAVTSSNGHTVNGLYEFYLIEKSNTSNQVTTQEHSFFHLHSLHILQFVVVLALIIIWISFRYYRK